MIKFNRVKALTLLGVVLAFSLLFSQVEFQNNATTDKIAEVEYQQEKIANTTPYFENTKRWLDLAVEYSSIGTVEFHLEYMEKYRQMSNSSYEDLGTTEEDIQKLITTGYFNEAKSWLDLAIKTSSISTVENLIEYMEKYRQMSNSSYEDLGTTKDGIQELLITGYFNQAQQWLDLAIKHSSSGNVESHLEYVEEYLEKSNSSYENIGTTEEDIQRLITTGYFNQAKQWLDLAIKHSSSGNVAYQLGYMEEYLEKSNSSYEEIGTTKEDVQKLLVTGYFNEAKNWLNLAIEQASHGNIDTKLDYMEEYLKKSNSSYEDIGTTEEDIKKLRKG